MSSEFFNTLSGYSVGIPAVLAIDATGNIVSNFLNASGNVTANNVFSSNYYYANGMPLSFQAGGNPNSIQFNSSGTLDGIPSVTWDGNTLSLGNVANLHIGGGGHGHYLQTDGEGNLIWSPVTDGTAPGGGNTAVQVNVGGGFGGNAAFTYNNDTKTVAVDGNLVANVFQMGYGASHFSISEVHTVTTNDATPDQILVSTPLINVAYVDYHIIATESTGLARQTVKLSALVFDGELQSNEYAGLYVPVMIGAFDVALNPGDSLTPPSLELIVSPDYSSLISYRILVTQVANVGF
jgi:hypothetical protein